MRELHNDFAVIETVFPLIRKLTAKARVVDSSLERLNGKQKNEEEEEKKKKKEKVNDRRRLEKGKGLSPRDVLLPT